MHLVCACLRVRVRASLCVHLRGVRQYMTLVLAESHDFILDATLARIPETNADNLRIFTK